MTFNVLFKQILKLTAVYCPKHQSEQIARLLDGGVCYITDAEPSLLERHRERNHVKAGARRFVPSLKTSFHPAHGRMIHGGFAFRASL